MFTNYFVNSFNIIVFSIISELKRRLKAQQKAKEKEAKEALKVIFVHRFVTVKHVVNVGFNFALTKALISQAQSGAVAQNKKKDEVDEETLDPNVSLSNKPFHVFGVHSFSRIHVHCSFVPV